MTAHNFRQSLSWESKIKLLPVWREVYKKAFPFLKSVAVENNLDEQYAGVDKIITLNGGHKIYVDEKFRGRNRITGKVYSDIALEYWSVFEDHIPGWVCKPLKADYIVYLICPSGISHFLPVKNLQSAWEKWETEWKKTFGCSPAKNGKYTTYFTPVPADIVFSKVEGCFSVSFEPFEVQL